MQVDAKHKKWPIVKEKMAFNSTDDGLVALTSTNSHIPFNFYCNGNLQWPANGKCVATEWKLVIGG